MHASAAEEKLLVGSIAQLVLGPIARRKKAMIKKARLEPGLSTACATAASPFAVLSRNGAI